ERNSRLQRADAEGMAQSFRACGSPRHADAQPDVLDDTPRRDAMPWPELLRGPSEIALRVTQVELVVEGPHQRWGVQQHATWTPDRRPILTPRPLDCVRPSAVEAC